MHFLVHRPIIRSRFCCKKDDIEENQRKLFKSIPKIRFCDSGCHLKTSSIQPAKVLVFVSINDCGGDENKLRIL